MKIDKSELKEIVKKLMNEIDLHFEGEIDTECFDYFWEVDLDEMTRIDEPPTNFALRQISDDWQELQRLLSTDGIPVAYDLIRLAAIFAFIKKLSSGKW